MKRTFYTLCMLILFGMSAIAQTNSNLGLYEGEAYYPTPPYPELFKYIPIVDENTPAWANMMYSANPNVKEVEIAYKAFYEEFAFEKTIHTQNYKHWRRNVYQKHFIDQNGFVDIPSEKEYAANLKNHIAQWSKLNSGEQDAKSGAGSWVGLGPYEMQEPGTSTIVTWQVNIYTMDQSVSNPDVLYVGTETGGVFKTTDKGLNWFSVGDNLILGSRFSMGSIKIDPTDPNIVFLADGSKLYRTLNGGTNWTEILNISGLNVNDISINPGNTQIVLLATEKGLYRSTDGGATFGTILYTEKCYDIEIKPTDNMVVYLLKNNPTRKICEFYKSTDMGATFTLKSSGWYNPANPPGVNQSDGGARMSVTSAPGGEDYIYCALLGNEVSYAQDLNWIGVYKSTDAGENWTLPIANGDPGGPYGPTHFCIPTFNPLMTGTYEQGFYNLGIAASDTDKEKYLLGCLNLYKSEDGGVTYTQWGGYGGGPGFQHPDVQEIEINGNDVWVASDGGMNLYSIDFSSLESRTKGINSSEFWGFGSGWNEDVLVGGRYHNGNAAFYQTYPTGKFSRAGGGEASTGYVQQGGNPRNTHFSDIGGKLLPTNIGDALQNISNYSVYPNENLFNESASEVVADPRCYNHLYLGKDNTFMKSINGGVSFTLLYTFGSTATDIVTGIEVARSNPDVMYAIQRIGNSSIKVWKTIDAGVNWTDLTLIDVIFSGGGGFISVDPTNENNVWLAYNNSGSSTFKIYRSTDGGSSWTNMTSTTLDGHSMQDVMTQGGTDGGVYLATDLGVFYRNNTHMDWQAFSMGAPIKMLSRSLRPFYRDGKIRNATYNTGIWESPFFETPTLSNALIQPTVDKLISTCARDTFYFDDYSMLNHTGATWSWAFTGGTPQYVSSTTVRNPKVVFGAAGTYMATLTVNGSFSKSISITTTNGCDPETVPGQAVSFNGTSDFATVPKFDIASNNFTISTWIKRNGDQTSFSGIFFQRGTSTVGLNFRDNNELGYHPNFGYSSGLIVPDNEWTHVAMVFEPNQVTLYMNGIPATNTTSHGLQTFDAPNYLASDPNNNARRFKGLMDEFAFYNKAMSQTEIRELMHLTRIPANDATLLRYYHFNEATGQVLDRVATQHADLNGSATRQTSTAPVGGGFSNTMDVSTVGGTKTFTSTDCVITFPLVGTLPEGDIVVSKINVSPDQNPGFGPIPPTGYWIIHNYGDNATFSTLQSIEFSGLSGINAGSPGQYSLFKRGSNADGNTWGTAIDMGDMATTTSITFSTGNGINSFSQFAINDGTVLPVELLNFGVELVKDKQVNVYWKTASEIDNDYFEVEWSQDARTFETLGRVASQSNTSFETLEYSFLHENPARGINYYRLKQVDLDGTYSYSNIRSIALEELANEFVIFPNPIAADRVLNIRTINTSSYRFTIYNAKGAKVFKGDYEGDAEVKLPSLNAGMYFYRIETDRKLINGKLEIVE